MQNKQLFCAPSLYTLFLYTLINDDWTESDFVLGRIPLVISNRLEELFGATVFNFPNRTYRNYFQRFYWSNKDYWDYRKFINNKHYDQIWGNDEFEASFPFRKTGVNLIEDGAFNSYSKHETQIRQFRNEFFFLNYWFYWIFQGYVSYGWSDYVKRIYHTTSIALPEQISYKGVEFDLKKTWDSLSESRKTDIFNLFGLRKEFVNKLNEYSTVLVTQVLPIPEEDKIEIYKRMTEGVDMSKVLIKTHYAETTDYSKVFPESTVINMPVPMQLFSLIGYNPTKVMTISSGAVGPFIKDGVEVVFLGTQVDPRIAAKYGVVTKETYMSNLNTK